MKICPLCLRECSEFAYNEGNDGVVEHGYECPERHFGFSWSYGSYEFHIGEKSLYWTYATDTGKQQRLLEIMDDLEHRAFEKLRRKLSRMTT